MDVEVILKITNILFIDLFKRNMNLKYNYLFIECTRLSVTASIRKMHLFAQVAFFTFTNVTKKKNFKASQRFGIISDRMLKFWCATG